MKNSNDDRAPELVQEYWGAIEEAGGMSAKIGPTLLAIAEKTICDEERLLQFALDASRRGVPPAEIRKQVQRGDHRRTSSGCMQAFRLK